MENEVCSLTHAQKLNELGFQSHGVNNFTVSKLSTLLPCWIGDSNLVCEKIADDLWIVRYSPMHDNENWSTGNNLADAMAEMLIYIYENRK